MKNCVKKKHNETQSKAKCSTQLEVELTDIPVFICKTSCLLYVKLEPTLINKIRKKQEREVGSEPTAAAAAAAPLARQFVNKTLAAQHGGRHFPTHTHSPKKFSFMKTSLFKCSTVSILSFPQSRAVNDVFLYRQDNIADDCWRLTALLLSPPSDSTGPAYFVCLKGERANHKSASCLKLNAKNKPRLKNKTTT